MSSDAYVLLGINDIVLQVTLWTILDQLKRRAIRVFCIPVGERRQVSYIRHNVLFINCPSDEATLA